MTNYVLLIGLFLVLPLAAHQKPIDPLQAPSPSNVEEQASSSHQSDYKSHLSPIAQQNKFLYGSVSLIPGAGLSDRARIGSKGKALDYNIGILTLGFLFDVGYKIPKIPIVSIDYNFLYFFGSDKETSPYLSYGVGALYFIPYVPLRGGIEFKYGFIDVGAKMFFTGPNLYWFFPFPEIRAGFQLKF